MVTDVTFAVYFTRVLCTLSHFTLVLFTREQLSRVHFTQAPLSTSYYACVICAWIFARVVESMG